MRNPKVRSITRMGMLFGLAMALSFLESALCPAFGLLPAVKIGLANIVVMFALLYLGKRQAFALVLLKAGFALITRGATAGLLSFLGSTLSYLVLRLLLALPILVPGPVFSACGAIAHNLGQIAGAALVLGSGAVWGYAPVLLLAGLCVGALTWRLLKSITPYWDALPSGEQGGRGKRGTGG